MEFSKPTIVKVAIAIVLFFFIFLLINVLLTGFCEPIPNMGAPWGRPQDYYLEGYPCGYISHALSRYTSETDSKNLQIIVAVISFSIPCLVLFLAHIMVKRQKM